jgi:hypothetical protein
MNTFLDCSMIHAALRGSPALIVGSQLMNQTYNAFHFFANRNGSGPILEDFDHVFGFVGATTAAVTVSLALKQMSTAKQSPFLRRLLPFFAVAAADVVNMSIVRRKEFLDGIDIVDEKNTLVGHSRLAGAYAVGACLAGRVAAAVPILVGPPWVLASLEKRGVFERWPRARLPIVAFFFFFRCFFKKKKIDCLVGGNCFAVFSSNFFRIVSTTRENLDKLAGRRISRCSAPKNW